MPNTPPLGLPDTQTLRMAYNIANRAVLEDIRSHAVATTADFHGGKVRCFDTRPMIDPRECSAEAIDMATEALAYAESCDLIERHHQHRYLVRVLVRM